MGTRTLIRRYGVLFLLLVAGGLVVYSLRPIFAASMPVKVHPFMGAGADASQTHSPNWLGGSHIVRVTGVQLNFSGNTVVSVTVSGTKLPYYGGCDVTVMSMEVTLLSSVGTVLGSGTVTLPPPGNTFNSTVTISGGGVPYHRIAQVAVSFQSQDFDWCLI